MADHIETHFFSPGSTSTADEYAANPRFIELQEELRYVLFAGVSGHDAGPAQVSKKTVTPTPTPAVPDDSAPRHDGRDGRDGHDDERREAWSLKSSLDSAGIRISIPKIKLVRYLQNWIVECAPFLDKFDDHGHFGIHVPILAEQSPPLLYAVLAFSARQIERKALLDKCYDSLELYQESIRLLGPSLQARDANTLVTACILAVLELMSGSSRNWRRHIEGCATLFDFFAVTGFSGGLLQAVFWCYARMELCGAIIAAGAESTVLPLSKWLPRPPPPALDGSASGWQGRAGLSPSPSPSPSPPPPPRHEHEHEHEHGHGHDMDAFARRTFYQHGRDNTGMHANWAVYLCAKACDLIYRRTRTLELHERDASDPRPFAEQWESLWQDLQLWLESRPCSMLPTTSTRASTRTRATATATTPTATDDDHPADQPHVFPSIFFPTLPAISSNQLYHTACILMLEARPPAAAALRLAAPHSSPIWHARRVCGISYTNPHKASLINAIQPLYVAGRLLTHPSEQLQVARLFAIIDATTGWGALWRLRDLEAAWGYRPGEMAARVHR
ncbi:hypothetical protein E4U53_006211 [Claviceps sorghi]|nr:hypothetical protein E4U53_006211 [Claviceps sorghi]